MIKSCVNFRSSTSWPEQPKLLVTEEITTTTIRLGDWENRILLSELSITLNQKERNSAAALCETVAKKYGLLCWMEQKGASLNKLGADSCTEMRLAGRETSSSVKSLKSYQKILKGTIIIQAYLDHYLVCWASCSPVLPAGTSSCLLWHQQAGTSWIRAGSIWTPEKCVCCCTAPCTCWEKVRQDVRQPRWHMAPCYRMRKAGCCHDAKAPDSLHSGLGCAGSMLHVRSCSWITFAKAKCPSQVEWREEDCLYSPLNKMKVIKSQTFTTEVLSSALGSVFIFYLP